jgi:predicted DNA-binding transcriptional regulator AlpA
MSQRMLNPKEAAARLNVTEDALRGMRMRGNGPPYAKLGHRTIQYPEIDLEIWIRSRIVKPDEEDSDESSQDD